MDKAPLFSITIPAYKRKFLRECITSVLSQEDEDYELVIVDDNSPENLKDVVDDYKDQRIRYYKNDENCGAIDVVDNWNKCLSYAKGKYLICMGDDDKLLPECLSEYRLLISRYPGLHVYHGRTEVINENSSIVDMQEARPEYESAYSLIWHRWTYGRIQYIGDFLFETDYLKKRGGFFKLPLAWGSDDITAIITSKEKGIANSLKPVFQYRRNSQTISKSGNPKIKMEAISIELEWYFTFLKEKCQDERDEVYRQLILFKYHNHFLTKKVNTVADDILSGHFWGKTIWWLHNYKVYNMSFKAVLYAIVIGIKCKIK